VDSVKNEDTAQAEIKLLKFEWRDSVNQPHTYGTVTGDITDSTIELSVDKEVDLTHLIASFEYRGERIMVDADNQESGKTQQDFSKPVTYTIRAIEGRSKSYQVKVHQTATQPENGVNVEVGGNGYKKGNGPGKIAEDGIVL